MKNYLDEVMTVEEFKDFYPKLAEKADKAMAKLKEYYPENENDEKNDDRFVVIDVEGYKCVAYITDDFTPYELGTTIVPFDENRLYPIQGLETKFRFMRYGG